MPAPFNLVWHWRGSLWRPIYKQGQRCRILARGSKNSVLVEFEDGQKVVCAKWAVRPAEPEEPTGQGSFFNEAYT